MKFGLRIPSLKKRIAAHTSIARVVRHSLGLKAPRGWGWLTDPKRALYNRIQCQLDTTPAPRSGPTRPGPLKSNFLAVSSRAVRRMCFMVSSH
jgi:hypothetical protein